MGDGAKPHTAEGAQRHAGRRDQRTGDDRPSVRRARFRGLVEVVKNDRGEQGIRKHGERPPAVRAGEHNDGRPRGRLRGLRTRRGTRQAVAVVAWKGTQAGARILRGVRIRRRRGPRRRLLCGLIVRATTGLAPARSAAFATMLFRGSCRRFRPCRSRRTRGRAAPDEQGGQEHGRRAAESPSVFREISSRGVQGVQASVPGEAPFVSPAPSIAR